MSAAGGAFDEDLQGKVTEARRTREIEIDVLVAHELAIGSVAATRIWDAAGIAPPPTPPVPKRQYHVDGRTADVMVASNGIEVLIEDKAAGGRFTEGQPEAYSRLPRERYRPVLIAPGSFLETHKKDVTCFQGWVRLEDLACALDGGAPKGAAAEAELAASYRHRANQLRECASDPAQAPPPHPIVESFGEAYREFVCRRNIQGVQVSPGSMKHERQREVEFVRWNDADPGFQAYHKLNLGCLDFRVPGYRIEQLRWLLDTVPAERRLPTGWRPSALQTKAAHPALRFLLPKVEVLDFDACKHVVEQALDALADLRRWWDGGGDQLLQGTSDDGIRWLVSHAADLARTRGWGRRAEELDALSHSLPG